MRELTYNNSRKSMLPRDYTKSAKFIERNYVFIAAIFAFLGAFSIGTCIGWSSNAIFLLSPEKFPLILKDMGTSSTREVCWIVSIFALGAVLSSLLVFKIWRFTGTKKLILLSAGFLIASWVLLVIYQRLILVLLARLLAGLAAGCIHFLVPVYIEDIASCEQRMTIDYIWQTFLGAGILVQFIAVFLGNMQLIDILSGAVPVALFIGFLFMPESPRYLCYKGESNAAKDILRKFREVGDEVDQDVHIWSNRKLENFSFRNAVRSPSSLRRLLPSLGMIVLDQLVGVWGAFFYISWIFRISGGEFSPEVASIIVAGIYLASIWSTKLLGVTSGDKRNLFWTGLLQAGSLIISGSYFHYRGSHGGGLEEYNYLPLACFGVHVFLYGMGLSRLSWSYSRILIPRSRYFTARSLCVAVSWAVLTISLRSYPGFIEFVGIGWLFWFMAFACIGQAIFASTLLPDLDSLCTKYIFDEDVTFQQEGEPQIV